MKILVLVKPTPDTEAKISIAGETLDLGSLKHIINPYDEFAIEQGLLFKEAGKADEVVLVSVADASKKDVLIKGLAMGADRAIMINSEGKGSANSLFIAQVLKKIIEKESPQVVLAGKQAIDDDNMQVPVMTAAALGWSHVNVATKMSLDGDTLNITREAEGGRQEEYKAKLPVVVGAHKSLNQPRYTSLPGIMKAKKKPYEELSLGDLGVSLDAEDAVQYTGFHYPPEKAAGKVVKDQPVEAMVDELVQYLKNEAKIIG